MQRPKINVKNDSHTKNPGSSTQISSNERKEELLVADACIWFSDIETEQSCNNETERVSALLVVQIVEELEHVFFGYDCIADFCASVFKHEKRVRKWEKFIAHSGGGFIFPHFSTITQATKVCSQNSYLWQQCHFNESGE